MEVVMIQVLPAMVKVVAVVALDMVKDVMEAATVVLESEEPVPFEMEIWLQVVMEITTMGMQVQEVPQDSPLDLEMEAVEGKEDMDKVVMGEDKVVPAVAGVAAVVAEVSLAPMTEILEMEEMQGMLYE